MLLKLHLKYLPVWAILLVLIGCQHSTQNDYRLLTIKGPDGLHNWSRYMVSSYFEPDSGQVMTMPAKNGDLLYFGNNNEFFLQCTADLPDTFQLKITDSLYFVNDKIVGIEINKEVDLLPWFRQMKTIDMKGLRSMMINGAIPPAYLPYLDLIAKNNPAIDLYFLDDSSALNQQDQQWLAKKFRPTIINISADNSDLSFLQAYTSVKTLSVSLDDSISQVTLPSMPGLKELDIVMNEEKEAIPSNFLSNNPQLQSLSIYGHFTQDEFNWKAMKQLKALRLYNNDSMALFPTVDAFPALQTLQLFGFGSKAIAEQKINGFKKLKELGLPGSMPQEVFNKLITDQPELEFLQTYASDTLLIKDFSVLQTTKQLQYFIISGDEDKINATTIQPLKRLKYLSLPQAFFKDSLQVAALKRALPDTVITPNSGVCMGAGWLLLLIPLVALLTLIFQQYKKTGTHA